MKKIRVALKINPYTIYIKRGIFKELPRYITQLKLAKRMPLIITTDKIYKIYGQNLKKVFSRRPHKILCLPDGERAKSQQCLFRIVEKALNLDKKKRVLIICFGGGVIGDVGSFAASIYKRGIPYLQVPTTYLAQIDASIGGKTAINLKQAKNMVGSFYQPRGVFIDPLFLKTLKNSQITEGLSESIKYGIIKDKKLF